MSRVLSSKDRALFQDVSILLPPADAIEALAVVFGLQHRAPVTNLSIAKPGVATLLERILRGGPSTNMERRDRVILVGYMPIGGNVVLCGAGAGMVPEESVRDW
jgi:hypothetical protein